MKKIFSLLCTLHMTVTLSHAQKMDSTLLRFRQFAQNIYTFNRLYPQEKVWLHCDNTAYFQGDTIWFAAYVTSAETLKPADDLSKVLYVELLNEIGEVVSTQRLQIKNGRCHGQIPLNTELDPKFINLKTEYAFYPKSPKTGNHIIHLPSGYYEVRAYTRAMLNWGTDICFSRIFPVFDTPQREGDYSQLTMKNKEERINHLRPKAQKGNRINVNFYPEGGHLTNNLPCRMAFKVTGREGGPIEAKVLLLANNTPLTESQTIHDGMGYVNFTPLEGVKYELRVRNKTFDLPQTKTEGVMLSVNTATKDSVSIMIAGSKTLRNKRLGITITCRGKLTHFKVHTITDYNQTKELTSIHINELETGVNQVTLFDEDGQIYAERLFFVRPTYSQILQVSEIDTTMINAFSKVVLHISSNLSKDSIPCSVSIRDNTAEISTTYTDNLQTYLLLTSDLKGYIHHPEFYFEADDSLHRTAIDLLMMTQGWRRYEWKQLSGVKEFKPTHFIEERMTLKGKITHPQKKELGIEGVKVAAVVSDNKKIEQSGQSSTNNNGDFAFLFKPFTGTRKLSLNITDYNGRLQDTRILLDRHFSPVPRKYLLQETKVLMSPSKRETNNIFTFTAQNVLEDVNINKNRKRMEQFTIHNITKKREEALDKGIKSDDYMSVKGYINSMYSSLEYPIFWGWHVGDSHDEYQELISNPTMSIENYRLEFVDYIVVYKNPQAHLHIKWNKMPPILNEKRRTIIVWAYKKPKKISGLRTTHIDGYSYVADYYHPQYNREIIPGEADYRRTLYWNPCLKLDNEGKATVTFYNNGVCKIPVVDIQMLNP